MNQEWRQAQRENWSNKPEWKPWIFLGVSFIILLSFAVLSPVVMKSSKPAPMTTATSNAKQIFYLLVEFDQEYNCLPNDDTAIQHFAGHGKGSYSNDYLRQLFLDGLTKSEEIFYAKGGCKPSKKPDGHIGNAKNHYKDALTQGECGFAYIKNISLTTAHPSTPILLAPMTGEGEKFNPDSYEGRMIALHADGSVKQYRIDPTTREGVTLIGGVNTSIFHQPGLWDGKKFDPTTLTYADSPYTYKPKLLPSEFNRRWLLPILGFLASVFILGNFARLWIKAQKAKRRMIELSLYPRK